MNRKTLNISVMKNIKIYNHVLDPNNIVIKSDKRNK